MLMLNRKESGKRNILSDVGWDVIEICIMVEEKEMFMLKSVDGELGECSNQVIQ